MEEKDLYEIQDVMKFFNEISNIPRMSGKEMQIANYLVKFAKDRGLKYYIDGIFNVIIWKEATTGYEKKEEIILQSHTDMICEKGVDSKHDFESDALELIIEGDYIKANNTTLGADNRYRGSDYFINFK